MRDPDLENRIIKLEQFISAPKGRISVTKSKPKRPRSRVANGKH